VRFVVDAAVLIHIAREQLQIAPEHELLAPTLIRSEVLSTLHEAVARGEVDARDAKEILARVNKLKIRLLGDAVLRRNAWEIADRLGWESTYDAEYIALTKLQADAFITLDEQLARLARSVVRVEAAAALAPE
jgi:predicted nucleic acid-binding protein